MAQVSTQDFIGETGAILVLYKSKLGESESYTSLTKSLMSINAGMDIVVYDNSLTLMVTESDCISDSWRIHYVHDGTNPGVSKAYNVGFTVGQKLGKRWLLLLLDQDTFFPENAFDAVTMNHVIEHVHDPAEIIEQAWRVLKKDGRLVITTPNASSISRKFFRDTWRGFEVPRHLWLFTAETLAMCATRAGLSDYKLTTTARSAAGIFLDSLEIKKGGCSSGANSKRVNWLARTGSFAYYNCEYVLNLIIRKIGDELVFTAVKR